MEHISDAIKERNIILETNDTVAAEGFTAVPNFILKNKKLSEGFITIQRRGLGKTNLYTLHFQVRKKHQARESRPAQLADLDTPNCYIWKCQIGGQIIYRLIILRIKEYSVNAIYYFSLTS
jgi:hypothetical protein